MAKSFYVYLHCKPDGVPFYVGKCYGNRSHEWRRRNQHHQNIVAKYGKDNIRISVFPCQSELQAFTNEIERIAVLRAQGYEIVNQTDGGQGPAGRKYSERAIANMSAGQLGNTNCVGYKHSPESRARMSAAQRRIAPIKALLHLGNKSRLGLPHSAETRAKISASHIGKKHSIETRAKMSLAIKTALAKRKLALARRN